MASSGQDWPKVAIVILNWNGWQDTLECLESIEKITYPNYEVILVDNGSADDSVARITEWLTERSDHWGTSVEAPGLVADLPFDVQQILITHRISLLRLPENLGFCIGNNIGMEFALLRGAEFILILNNDTIVTLGFLEPLVEAARRNPEIGLVGGIICYAQEPDKIWFAGGRFDGFLETNLSLYGSSLRRVDDKPTIDTDLVSGCLMLIPAAVYRRIGGFNSQFFFWSEDWDYSFRVRKAGYRLVVATRSRVYHKIGRSAGVLKPLSYYYGTRNRLLLKKMYLPWGRRSLFMIWFLTTRIIRYMQFALQGRWDLVRAGCEATIDYFAGRTGKWRRHVG